jgi:alpha-beta hydrolase superfamily lysophospholipase
MKKHFILIALLLISLVSSLSLAQNRAKQPKQPTSGPGSSSLTHTTTTKNHYGSGATEYFLYEPADPKPTSAPVIVFVHGFGAINPITYGAWIDHLVRRGNIVIYPRYQLDSRTPPKEFTPNAISSIKDAINRLQNENGHVLPDLGKFAIVGHSAGGIVTANLAAEALFEGLPSPRAVMSVAPGKSMAPTFPLGIPLANLGQIPRDTLLLTLAGDVDNVVGDADAKRIFQESTQVLSTNKNFIIVQSDNHGQPLIADHGAPSAIDKQYDSGEKFNGQAQEQQANNSHNQMNNNNSNNLKKSTINVNGLDFYGYWKLFDGLCDAAFFGTNRDYALGNTELQRYMGQWSDGVAVKQLIVTTAQ